MAIAVALGKLHVYPQRNRIGFDEVLLCEEGRHHLGGNVQDDFERFRAHQGYTSRELSHGMGNNVYTTRPWHQPESSNELDRPADARPSSAVTRHARLSGMPLSSAYTHRWCRRRHTTICTSASVSRILLRAT